jgi:hypothetical protein
VPQRTSQTAEQAKGKSKLALRPTLIPKAMNAGFFVTPKAQARSGAAGEPKIDTTISVHFLCGFHIEIGNAFLPRSLHG